MKSRINNEKIKSTKSVVVSIAVFAFAIFIVAGIVIYGFLDYFSGSPAEDTFSKYNEKVYSVASEDGKIQGYIAFKEESCGEFSSDVCLNVYYNFLVKDALSVEKGIMSFGNVIGDKGNLQPIYCDADISKIDLFNRHDGRSLPFVCNGETLSNTQAKSFYASSLDVFRIGDSIEGFPEIGTINIYNLSGTTRKLIKTYQVNVALVK